MYNQGSRLEYHHVFTLLETMLRQDIHTGQDPY